MKKDFLTVNDFTKEELMDIINLSIAIKKSINSGYNPPLMNSWPCNCKASFFCRRFG